MEVKLKEVNAQNWSEVIKLEVHPEQRNFVASNVYSLAEAYARPEGREYRPMAIYHEAKVVGFAMQVWEPSDESVQWVQRFMIARESQGRGLGRAGMVELLKLIKQNKQCRAINLSVEPENTAAQELYKSLGFEDTGLVEEGEMVFSLRVNKAVETTSEAAHIND